MPTPIYHLCRRADWESALRRGFHEGSADDRSDGFLHFSTAAQVRASAARHRAGVADLVMLAVDAESLGTALKWEPSRGGALFPHLYGPLPVDRVLRVDDLPLQPDGRHLFPSDLVLVDRIQRLVPKLWIGRSTKLLIWWFDSANGWDSSVGIEPLDDAP